MSDMLPNASCDMGRPNSAPAIDTFAEGHNRLEEGVQELYWGKIGHIPCVLSNNIEYKHMRMSEVEDKTHRLSSVDESAHRVPK